MSNLPGWMITVPLLCLGLLWLWCWVFGAEGDEDDE